MAGQEINRAETIGKVETKLTSHDQRVNVSSGGKWEAAVGYSRAVRVGNVVCVAGTTAADNDGDAAGDAYAQTVKTLQTIESALREAGATLENVVRTRLFVTNMERDSEAIGRAHGEFFHAIRPAATMVEVRRLISDAMLIEIEAEAVLF